MKAAVVGGSTLETAIASEAGMARIRHEGAWVVLCREACCGVEE